jgi:hypothetical protein
MIPAERREILRVLERLSEFCPDVRFGQLIANLAYLAREPSNEAIWDVEDAELLAAAQTLLRQREESQSSVA